MAWLSKTIGARITSRLEELGVAEASYLSDDDDNCQEAAAWQRTANRGLCEAV
jgi:hypothetical protein